MKTEEQHKIEQILAGKTEESLTFWTHTGNKYSL